MENIENRQGTETSLSKKESVDYLKDYARKAGISLSEEQLQQFYRYYEILVEWNQVMNLTAITDYKEVVLKHFIDSISLIQAYDLTQEISLLDVGTGAGFPGIPLKIAFPKLKVTLLDSLNKRVQFLNHVIEELGLSHITAIHGRAEDYAKQKEYREQYDLCVSRAVSNLASLSEYCIPYVKVGGYFISYKSGNCGEEVEQAQKAIKVLGGQLKDRKEFVLPDSDISRSFIFIEKVNVTGKKYPRKAGLPTKEPIG